MSTCCAFGLILLWFFLYYNYNEIVQNKNKIVWGKSKTHCYIEGQIQENIAKQYKNIYIKIK